MTWSTSTPANTDLISLGDDVIREFKQDVATALTTEGVFPGSDTANPKFKWTGKRGATASRPASPSTGELYFNTQLFQLEYYDGGSWVGYDLVPANGITTAKITDANVTTAKLSINADVPMGSNKLTGLAAGTANGHSVRYEQIAATASNAALTITDGSGNAFSSVSTDWWYRPFNATHYELNVGGSFTTHASATGAALRLSGFGITINTGGTLYSMGGSVIVGGGTEVRGLLSPSMISSSVIQVSRQNGGAWATATGYSFTLRVLLPL